MTCTQYKNDSFFKFHNKMRFTIYFFGLLAVSAAGVAPSLSIELNKYEIKLRKYQNMTNIDEATFQAIWNKSFKKRKLNSFRQTRTRPTFPTNITDLVGTAGGSTPEHNPITRQSNLKMARYSMATAISYNHSPVRWDTEEFNLGIIYNNGVITIDEPGYYRITSACYMDDNRDKEISLQTIINDKAFVRTWSMYASPGSSYAIKYLEMFDTIFFRKDGTDRMKMGSLANYFTIEKL